MKDINSMTLDEHARYMSSGRLTTGTITQIEDGQFVTYWVARTRGYVVSIDDNWKHKTKEAAREYGRKCLAYYDKVSNNEAEALAMRYRDALVRLDEIHTMLVRTIQGNRIMWDEHTTEESVLSSFNAIAKQMYEAIPEEIRVTK